MKDDAGSKRFGKPSGMTRAEGREFLRKWGAGELKGQYVEQPMNLSA